MKPAITIISVVCAIIGISYFLTACGGSQSSNPSSTPSNGEQQTSDPISLSSASSDVQSIYKARCINCHATDLSGKMGERTNLQHIYVSSSNEDIVATITNGGSIMPAFKDVLSEQEINSLATWLSNQ
ncbi:MAG: cytochrome c [Candidatus Pristimantibacillus lignocellulolyticus]|uniref:Cytochrome c n=1 Tax=Candidatus Pristimantibacillus lignocellulolyticus TaxID=2994561 RepID=A0A9J6ZFK2_9BACL|nr:MAG: cytochrome c [Candidatus Pristimantibacillus lignocellulolyticus]